MRVRTDSPPHLHEAIQLSAAPDHDVHLAVFSLLRAQRRKLSGASNVQEGQRAGEGASDRVRAAFKAVVVCIDRCRMPPYQRVPHAVLLQPLLCILRPPTLYRDPLVRSPTAMQFQSFNPNPQPRKREEARADATRSTLTGVVAPSGRFATARRYRCAPGALSRDCCPCDSCAKACSSRGARSGGESGFRCPRVAGARAPRGRVRAGCPEGAGQHGTSDRLPPRGEEAPHARVAREGRGRRGAASMPAGAASVPAAACTHPRGHQNAAPRPRGPALAGAGPAVATARLDGGQPGLAASRALVVAFPGAEPGAGIATLCNTGGLDWKPLAAHGPVRLPVGRTGRALSRPGAGSPPSSFHAGPLFGDSPVGGGNSAGPGSGVGGPAQRGDAPCADSDRWCRGDRRNRFRRGRRAREVYRGAGPVQRTAAILRRDRLSGDMARASPRGNYLSPGVTGSLGKGLDCDRRRRAQDSTAAPPSPGKARSRQGMRQRGHPPKFPSSLFYLLEEARVEARRAPVQVCGMAPRSPNSGAMASLARFARE